MWLDGDYKPLSIAEALQETLEEWGMHGARVRVHHPTLFEAQLDEEGPE